MLELLSQLVSIRSMSCEEDACADFVIAWARELGFQVDRIGNNVVIEYGTGSPRLMLNSHIDTVQQCNGWQADPWTPRISNGRLTGLGANDAKGCVAAMLLAAAHLKQQDWDCPGTLVLLISAEEEIGGEGGVQRALAELPSMDAAINGEPTALAPCTAQRGMLLLNCRVQGSSGHAAHAHALGLRNAVHAAAEDIVRLSELEFEPFRGEHVSRPQVTVVGGGISHNQVPDNCEYTVDLRTTPNLDNREVLQQLRRILQAEIHCEPDKYRPVSIDHAHPLAAAAIAASDAEPYFSNTCSDWNLYPQIPCVKIGPGDSSRSHRPEEYLLETELQDGVRVYADIIRRYFKLVGA